MRVSEVDGIPPIRAPVRVKVAAIDMGIHDIAVPVEVDVAIFNGEVESDVLMERHGSPSPFLPVSLTSSRARC